MSWRGSDDDEAEREMERARAQDGERGRGAVTMGQLLPMRGGRAASVPPQMFRTNQVLRCMNCGHESAGGGWRVHPRGGGIVCAGRFDETGLAIDCHDRLDRQLAIDLGREVDDMRRTIREANERSKGPRGRGYEP